MKPSPAEPLGRSFLTTGQRYGDPDPRSSMDEHQLGVSSDVSRL